MKSGAVELTLPSIGAFATVLATIGFIKRLEDLADRSNDRFGLDMDEERLPRRIVPRPLE